MSYEFVKSLYVDNIENIEDFLYTGIETLFFTNRDILRKYADGEHLTVIPVVNYIQPYTKLQLNEQFFDGEKYYKWLPCPTSREATRKLLEYPLELYYNEKLCSAICIDFLSNIEYLNGLNFYDCKCDRCKGLTEHQKRYINAKNINEKIGPISLYSIIGVDPYIWGISDWWINKTIQSPSKEIKRMKNIGVSLFNSLYVNDIKGIKSAYGSPNIDGYCLNASIKQSDVFFAKLKLINDDISKYRQNNMWFNIKRRFN